MAANEKEVGALHQLICKTLLDRIASGEASAADISNAIKFVKDCGVKTLQDADTNLDKLTTLLQGIDIPENQ